MVQIKSLVAALVLACSLMYAGWYGHGVYYGYKENQAREVQELVKDGMKDIEQKNAAQLEDLKGELKNIKPTVKQNTIIIKNPSYNLTCSDSEGVDVLEKYKADSNAVRAKYGIIKK